MIRLTAAVAAMLAATVPGFVRSDHAAAATTLSLTPSADTYVSSANPSVNYGAGSQLQDSAVSNRTLVRFDTSGIPAGSTVTSVQLAVYALSSPSSGGIRVHPESTSWTEAATTWSTQPAWNTTVLATSATPVSGHWLSVDLPTSSVVVGSSTNLGLDFSVSGIIMSLDSRESSYRPQLTVAYNAVATTGAPSATTGSATGVTTTAANLGGTASDNGALTSCWFDYGSTTQYTGKTATQTIAAGSGATAVSASVAGLTSGSTYHYRLACTNAYGAGYGADASFTAGHQITKVLTIVEENHSLTEMRSQMPYLSGLSDQYGYATQYKGITHPSLPNYLAIAGGSTFAVTDDNPPSSHPISGASVFGQAISAGRTAKSYDEDMTTNCQLSSSGNYAVKHNPWAYFTDERSSCGVSDVPTGTPTSGPLHNDIAGGTLPNVGMVTPNLCNDAHNCSLSTADAWLKSWLPQILSGADFTSGHLAVVVTADEDDQTAGNLVLTTVIAPDVHGKVVSTALNHYSLTRFQEQVAGVTTYLRNAATAADLAAAFGLVVGP